MVCADNVKGKMQNAKTRCIFFISNFNCSPQIYSSPNFANMKTVNASIITIGDELLISQTIDTNSAWMGEELNKIGVWVKRRVAVGDVWDDIWNALDEESKTADIILITGGLGPTADDITKPLLSKYFRGKLVINEQVLAHVK